MTGIATTLVGANENTIPAVDNLHIIFYLSIGRYITETFQLILSATVAVRQWDQQASTFWRCKYAHSAWWIVNFPEGTLTLRGTPIYYLTNLSRKLHDNEKILTQGGHP